MALIGLRKSFVRGCRQIVSRRIYVVMTIVLPVALTFFFLSLLGKGLPTPVPTAIIDNDNTSMSRALTRQLRANANIEIRNEATSYATAMDMVNRGEIIGFFLVPSGFESDAIGGRKPVVSYYCNMTYFIPASLIYKGFKATAITTSGSVVRTSLVSSGMDENLAGSLLQPIVAQEHPIGNPWISYNIYLTNSFVPGLLALLIMLTTCFSIWEEIKKGRSRQWLAVANGSMTVAVVGKLLPQTIIFSVVGVFVESLFYGYYHLPMNGSILAMISAMILFVIANQSFAFILSALIPNMRLAISIASLVCVLSFSITGFSFPLESMYSALSIWGYIPPVRHYFSIYINEALYGLPLYYSRISFAALLVYPLIALAFIPRMRTIARRQLYTP